MKFEYYFARAILKKLWVDGLLTEEEFLEIDGLNAITWYNKR